MNDKIKVTSREGLLAFLVHMLGFVPSESLVFVTMAGNKLGATLRVDIPTNNGAAVAAHVAGMLRNHKEATATIMAVYTDTPGDHPHTEAVKAVELELLAADMPVMDALLVTSAGWRPYFEAEAAVSALASITDSATNAELIFHGSNPDAGKPRNPEFSGPLGNARSIAVLAANLGDIDRDDLSAPLMREARAAWTRALGTTPEGKDACLLVAYIQSNMLRDRILADFYGAADEDFAAALVGEMTTRPNWERADQAHELLLKLLPQTPDMFRAPLFTALGFLAWYKGQSTMANGYFQLALDSDRDYRLAQLLVQVTELGILPKVATDPENGYRQGL